MNELNVLYLVVVYCFMHREVEIISNKFDMAKMDALLLQKIEVLTLYVCSMCAWLNENLWKYRVNLFNQNIFWQIIENQLFSMFLE